ncbi:N-acetylmuramoyl-L-alanine amidase [Dethiothermospora halolimnae]|uniref:N-acetylmuramoyl-L-alanine amidase n=1 Tax=Dethiothermospora halolimnae TaxID=3114390 RepID=UPI003CCC409E
MDDEQIKIKVYNHKTNKIEIKPIEEIVKMIVFMQINIGFNIEAIKCQAIIARTDLIRKLSLLEKDNNKSWHISDNYYDIYKINEKYLKDKWRGNYKVHLDKLNTCINDTRGLIITINNNPIDPRFHNTCGGATENSESVIENRVIYLRKVLCDYCGNSPHWDGSKEFTLREIEDRLNVKFPKISPNLKTEIKGFIEDIIKDDSERITEVKVGGKKFKGDEIVRLLGLDSRRFSISPVVIRFNTRGKGTGLGLCQYGSNQMAKEGYKFEDILKYYYTGVTIKKYDKPCMKKPLKGKILVIDPAHGGFNCNDAIGENGLREKDVVFDISKIMANELMSLGADVYLTRKDDIYLSLNDRKLIADEKNPDFFINISMNSFHSSSIKGCEIYHYRGDKDAEALSLSIMNKMEEEINTINKGIKSADFFLLRELGCSSIQIYPDYITNPTIEKKLKNPKYINKIAKAIVSGIVSYHMY